MATGRGRGRRAEELRNEFSSEDSDSSGASSCSGMVYDTDRCSIYSNSIASSEEEGSPPSSTHGSAVTPALSKVPVKEAGKEKSVPNLDYSIMRKMTASTMSTYGLNLNQDVKTYKDLVARRIMPYRIRRVVSPYEFYMEFTNVPPSRVYATWFHEMQVFYQDPNNRENLKVFKGVPLLGRCYACKDPNDQKWHRVRVHQIMDHNDNNGSSRTFVVYYLDLCKLQETLLPYLLELDARFAESPAQVLRCFLHDVRPNNNQGILLTWSPEACRYFQEVVEGKEFTGIVLTRSDELVSKGMPDFVSTVGVVLVENIPGTKQVNPDTCTLNAHMVDAKFAVATGVCAGCKHTLFIEGCVPSFDQSEFDRLYPPPPPPTNDPSDKKENVEDNKTAVVETWKGEQTVLLPSNLAKIWSQVRTTAGQTLEEAELEGITAYYRNTTVELPEQIACRLANINIVFVSGPSYIMAHLKSKQEELKAMQKAMERLAANENPLPDGQPGTFVSCCILERNSDREDSYIWCRGLIKSVQMAKTKLYKILLVDFGNEVTVESVFVHLLPPYFEKIPSFAIRLHLDANDFLPAGCTGWSMDACVEFCRYTSSWENKEPNYFCFRPSNAGPLELNHFTQPIIYGSTDKTCTDRRTWAPAPRRKAISHKAVDPQRRHNMMRNLYVSFGVDIHYEILVPNSHFWHFETIADTLLRDRHAVKPKARITPTKHHMEVLGMATSSCVDKSPIIGSKND